jgi:hypothetical protein
MITKMMKLGMERIKINKKERERNKKNKGLDSF